MGDFGVRFESICGFGNKGNMESNGIPGSHRVVESGVGEDLTVPENTRLVVWNLPYLEREDEDDEFEKIEEIAWSEISGKRLGQGTTRFLGFPTSCG